jgi:hypothetical protein
MGGARIQTARLKGCVMPAYTQNVGVRLKKIETLPLFKGNEVFQHAMGKFGIKNFHADISAEQLLIKNNEKLCYDFAKACQHVPEFSPSESTERIEEKRHELFTALNTVFGVWGVGIKVVLSNDLPDIYFLKTSANVELFNIFVEKFADLDGSKGRGKERVDEIPIDLYEEQVDMPEIEASKRIKPSVPTKKHADPTEEIGRGRERVEVVPIDIPQRSGKDSVDMAMLRTKDCPQQLTLIRLLYGAIRFKKDLKKYYRHIKECGNCADEILRLKKLEPRKEDISERPSVISVLDEAEIQAAREIVLTLTDNTGPLKGAS